jgi:hypothetical protein
LFSTSATFPPVANLSPLETQECFQMVFRQFAATHWMPFAIHARACTHPDRAARGRRSDRFGGLIIDNETPLVALAEEILAELGYEPGFSSSVAALRAFRESPQRFYIELTGTANRCSGRTSPNVSGASCQAEQSP